MSVFLVSLPALPAQEETTHNVLLAISPGFIRVQQPPALLAHLDAPPAQGEVLQTVPPASLATFFSLLSWPLQTAHQPVQVVDSIQTLLLTTAQLVQLDALPVQGGGTRNVNRVLRLIS